MLISRPLFFAAAVLLPVLSSPAVGQPAERPAGKQKPGQRPAPRIPENVVVERDVVYGDAGNRPLKLDLVLPKAKSDSPRPLIVFIHGGGWRAGDKAGGVGRVIPFVATGNYVGASVGYRLSGEAVWPAQIHDCKAAIRWLRANAKKYGIDPARIGVWGGSAGGHLVNMLGTSGDVKELEGNCGSPEQSSRVSCVVPFCGPTNFLAPRRFEGGRRPSAVDLLLGGKIEEKQDLAKQASPITYVSKDDPPFLIVHGTADNTVPFEQAEMFDAALRKAGVAVTFVKIIGGGHGIGGPAVQERVTAFFEKHLRGQQVEVSSEPIQTPEPR
jgi:acetyl esterase/lipase